MEAKTTALAAVKQDVRLQEWSAQIEAQQTGSWDFRRNEQNSRCRFVECAYFLHRA
ncbi:MAG: hypothetical protein VZR73_11340 [Acutalibacteraceae bacterium]|nr:hypothetical protein [Acutalibacteraceae bacterium]